MADTKQLAEMVSVNNTLKLVVDGGGLPVSLDASDAIVALLPTAHKAVPGGADKVNILDSVSGLMKWCTITELLALVPTPPAAPASAYAQVTTDKTTVNHTSTPSIDLLVTCSLTIASTVMRVDFSANITCTGTNNNVYFAIFVDTVLKKSGRAFVDPTSGDGVCGIGWRATGLTPGAHTVDVYWSCGAGTAKCLLVTDPTQHHAELELLEVA